MKVFVVGPQYADCFARNIAVTLELMGFQVSTGIPALLKGHPKRNLLHFLYTRAQMFPRIERRLQEDFVRAVEKTKPQLLLVSYVELTPSTVRQLRGVVPAVVAWYPDPTANLGREYLLAADYQCVLFKEPEGHRVVPQEPGFAGLPPSGMLQPYVASSPGMHAGGTNPFRLRRGARRELLLLPLKDD